MGAGRKTKTILVSEKSLPPSTACGIDTARNLGTENLAAVIFGCKNDTIEECFARELFGLPPPHYAYVRNIKPGLPLFLFNYSDRTLHGIFEAVCTGRLNIKPEAWTEEGSDRSPYPAQVKFRVQMHCQPLKEDQFRPIIAQNYHAPKLFWFELDKSQAKKLISLFSSFPMTPREVNHQRTLFGSYARQKQELEYDNHGKQREEVAHANVIPGFSYSSALKCTSSSFDMKDQPHDGMATSSQKTWSSLFNTGTIPDAKSRTSCPKIQSLALNDSYVDQPNLLRESSSDTCQENLISEVTIREDSGNYGTKSAYGSDEVDEFGLTIDERQWSTSYEDDGVGLSQDEKQCRLSDPPLSWEAAGEKRDEVDEFGLTADEWQWGSSYEADEVGLPQDEKQRSSSYGPLSSEKDSQPSENHKNGDTSKEECFYAKANRDYSLHASTTNMVFVENSLEKVALEKSREAIVSEIRPPEVSVMVSQLLQEVQELKESLSVQSQRISLLEQELITSRFEIQQLKDANRTSKSSKLDIKELIFVVGGFDGSSWFSSLDAYSPFEDLKRPLTPMSSLRAHASAVNFNGQLYVLGGLHGNCFYDKVESYDPASNKWVSHPPLVEKKGHMAGVTFDNKIFSIGGGNEVYHFSEVEMLDVNVGRWILVRSMLEKRYAPAAAELGGAVYAAGGFNGKDFLDSVERLDPREPSWNQLKSMTSKRAFHSMVVLDDKLYALGGFNGHKMLSSVETFDPRLGKWRLAEGFMTMQRGYFGAFVMRDAIYVLGGLGENNQVLDTVECYKACCGWQSTNLKGIGKRCFFASAVL